MSTATDFQDLIDALETNLQLMGVDDAEFDRSTGILGLVDRITDIEPSTNIDLDITCTLSSSENSIDYGESIVLTATLLASYDDTSANNVDLKTGEITGATIQFKQGNTVIGTGITNNNGVATLTYTPTTNGTLNITANFNGTINFNRATSTGINVLVNETLTLTSDKTILSAADNESATLTATLHAANNSGQTVTFEVRKASDDSLVETLTGVTDSSGKATVSYLGKATGDLYIKCFSSDLIIVSELCHIYDIYYANTGVTDKSSDFNIAGEIVIGNGSHSVGTTTITHSNGEYSSVQTGAGNWNIIPITQLTNTNLNFEISIKTYCSGNNGISVGMISGSRVFGVTSESNQSRAIDTKLNSYDWSATKIATLTNGEWYKTVINKQGSTITMTAYDSTDTLLGTKTFTHSASTWTVGLWQLNANSKFKEILFKQL